MRDCVRVGARGYGLAPREGRHADDGQPRCAVRRPNRRHERWHERTQPLSERVDLATFGEERELCAVRVRRLAGRQEAVKTRRVVRIEAFEAQRAIRRGGALRCPRPTRRPVLLLPLLLLLGGATLPEPSRCGRRATATSAQRHPARHQAQ